MRLFSLRTAFALGLVSLAGAGLASSANAADLTLSKVPQFPSGRPCLPQQ